MVKKNCSIILLLIILSAAALTFGCNNDLSGLFTSTDLDERLKSKNDFPFLNRYITKDNFQNEYNFALNPVIPDTYKFLVLTDTHIEDGNDFGLIHIKEAVKTHEASFVVVLGDITQNGKKQDIDLFIKIAENDMDVPFYPVIGNHDIYFGNWNVWRDTIGSTNYKIEIKTNLLDMQPHTTLLFLDSANSFFGKQQLDWLENEIKKTGSKNIFVFNHVELFSAGIRMQQSVDTKERARIVSILKDKADIMFSGHIHKRVINEAGNVRYVTLEDFKSTGTYAIIQVNQAGVSCSFEKL